MNTICQIATPLGVGGISIIKVSGDDAILIVSKVFQGKNLNEAPSHSINYGYIVEDDLKIDEVLVSIMRAPNSSTGEDIVEINCHGGILMTEKILKLLVKKGASLAEPGDFTKRAYLNGKKTIEEVENIADILYAKNEGALEVAISTLNHSSKILIEDLRQNLLEIVANIEVNIDYPEYEDLNVVTNSQIAHQIEDFISLTKEIIHDSKAGEIIKSGLKTAIVGKPNVGKSSILNYLSRNEKAIVTNVAGTTRDIIESDIILGKLSLNLIDTAGIRQTDDEVEKIGVQKSFEALTTCDLILVVLDKSQEVLQEELDLIREVQETKTKYLIIINKDELDWKINLDDLNIHQNKIVFMSALNKYGEKELTNKIEKTFDVNDIKTSDLKYVSNLSDVTQLERVLENMYTVLDNINNQMFIDVLSIDLKESLFILSEILGLNPKEDYLNEIFSRFCLGK